MSSNRSAREPYEDKNGIETRGDILNLPPLPTGLAMSSMMASIKNDSMTRARTVIANKFKDPVDLDDLDVYKSQLKKQMALADSQLNGAVQGKLEALKRAVDLMDESALQLSTFADNMRRVDERIAQSNTAISNFEYLRRVHFARENLQKVISQVEFFARVPERVLELKTVLDSDPNRLKEVFLEALKLQALRNAMMNELVGSSWDPSVDNPRESSKRRSVTDYGGMDITQIRVTEAVDAHLHIVPELMSDVNSRLFTNIERIFDLAVDNPANLVMTFEVIEMYQEYLDRRAQQYRKRAGRSREAQEQAALVGYDDISGAAKQRLKQKLSEKVESNFAMAHAAGKHTTHGREANESEDNVVTSTLQAATHLLTMMAVYLSDVVPCIPPSYEPMAMFIDSFEEQLVPEVKGIVKDLSSLDVADMMQIVDWIEFFDVQMDQFGYGNRPCSGLFQQIAEDLLQEYLHRIKGQIMKWFENIKKQPLEITKAADNTLITTNPEDMFNVIHVQVEVAREKLPAEHLKDVINACLQVLREVQRQGHDILNENWKEMEMETLCALINDNQRMQEKCEEFADKVVQSIPQEDQREFLTIMLEEVSNEYVTMAMSGITYLARAILEDLEEPVFSRLFVFEWETGFSESLCSVLVATLQDYFQDIQTWLLQYFYCKLVREVLHNVTGMYIMSLRRLNAPTAFHFNSEIMAARKIISDMETIQDFFESHAETLHKAGLKAKVEGHSGIAEELEPIECFARVVSATHISGAERDVRVLFDRYGADGLKVVQSAINSNPSLSKAERTDCIDKAGKMFDRGGAKYAANLSEVYKTTSGGGDGTFTKPQPQKKKSRFFWGRSKK